MKRAKLRKLEQKIKPRNLVALAPILQKGGAHQRTDKRAERARPKAMMTAELS